MYDNPVPFILPVSKIPEYIMNEKEIIEPVFPEQGHYVIPSGETTVLCRHIVEKGDYLNKIALRYHCSIDDIMKWNSMNSPSISSGQELLIWVPESLSKQMSLKTYTETKPAETDKVTSTVWHIVKKGDNLYSISNMYKGVTVEGIKRANNFGEDYVLLPGARLLIPQP